VKRIMYKLRRQLSTWPRSDTSAGTVDDFYWRLINGRLTQTDGHRQTDRQTDRDRETDIQRQTYRQTDIQTDRQTDRQTYTHTLVLGLLMIFTGG